MLAIVVALFLQEGVSREEFERMKKELEELRKLVTEKQDKPLSAQEREEFEKMKRELEELRRKVEGRTPPQDKKTLPEQAPSEKAGTVYGKPFLLRAGRGVYVGGYLDLEYFNTEDSNNDTFDQHRLVPFLYADVSEHIKVATEIEIEHGGELGVEFAHIDYWWADQINLRAGIILDPVGKFNLVHDAPFQDLTHRPLVDTLIIPAVLREAGIGLFGTFDADPWTFSYEVYVTNGFKGLSKTGTNRITTSNGLRDARPIPGNLGSFGRDFNDNKSFVGRFAVSPFLGFEFGLSTHVGKYDERGDNLLGISAIDWTVDLGGVWNKFFEGEGVLHDIFFAMEIVGEIAWADIERDDFAKSKGVPNDMRGWFIEFRYHFMFDFLREAIPGCNEDSTFTIVLRWDDTDLDNNDRRAVTLGLNFRPREDTVFKFEYRWKDEGNRAPDIDDDTFAFGVATYF
jgi:hypothetical protein